MAGLKGNVAWWAAAKQTGRISIPATATVNGAVSASATVVVNSVIGISVGQTVSGTGVTGNPTVSTIVPATNTLTLSSTQTIANNAVLTFTSSAPATAATKAPFSGGGIMPTRETANLSETDSSRDMGLTYLVRTGAEGTIEAYARDSYAHVLLTAGIGTDTVSGTNPNFTHTITPSSGLPYFTFWRNQDNVLYEQFTDCQVSELTVKGEAGAPLTISASIMGLTPSRSATEPTNTSSVSVDTSAVYNFNDLSGTGASVAFGGTASTTTGQVTGGTASRLVRSFELSVNNNVNIQQTDSIVPYDLVAAQREVNLSFDIVLENLNDYNSFFYGSATGTTASTTIFTTPMVFTFGKSTNNSIAFHLPSVAYEAFPVEPNPNGDPIVVSVRAQAQRFYSTTGAALPVTAIVKNQVSTAA